MKNPRLVAFRARMIALALLFLAGVGLAAYPFLTNAQYQSKADEDLAALDAAIAAGDPEAFADELERAREYNTALVGQTVPDVFAIREGTTDDIYESFLAFGNTQAKTIIDNQNRFLGKYSPNRAQRRAAAKNGKT